MDPFQSTATHHVAYPAVYRWLMALALAFLALSWVGWVLALRPVGDAWPAQVQWGSAAATLGASAPWWPQAVSSDRPPAAAATPTSPASSPDTGLKLVGGVTGSSVFVLVQKSGPSTEPARLYQPGDVLDGRWRLETITPAEAQGALKSVWRDIHTQQERVLMAPLKSALPPHSAVKDQQSLSRTIMPGP